MKYLCFKCFVSCQSIRELCKHLRDDHLLKDNHPLFCKQKECVRVFNNFNSFRKHLHSHEVVQCSIEYLPQNLTVCMETETSDQTNKEVSQNDDPVEKENFSQSSKQSLKNTMDYFETLSAHMSEFKNAVNDFVIEMYNNSPVPRKFIQFVIKNLEELFCSGLLYSLKSFILNRLSALGENGENLRLTEDSFSLIENCFSDINTECKCLKLYKEKNIFVPAESVEIVHDMQKVSSNKDFHLQPNLQPFPIFLKLLSLPDLLTKLLNKDNLLLTMRTYIAELNNDGSVISNFIQCDLWKSKISTYKNIDIVFPLFLHFDDYETGNPLGSHSGVNKVGAVYVSLPSMPPYFTSKLSNMFLFALFYSKHRKLFGNTIFNKLIEQLQYVQNDGIKIGGETVYFKLGLICGDNLGLHSILGLTESFSASYCCRFCKAKKESSRLMTVQDEGLMRNIESYNWDVLINDVGQTGIKEMCIWHKLSDFHLTSNFSVDIMHDLFEGVCNYDLTALLNSLISDLKLFTIDTLNDRIQSFHTSFIENSTKPPIITLDRLKSTLKMSASEMIFFSRNLGLIVGHLIPDGLDLWELWIKLREIIDLVTASTLHCEDYIRLKVIIQEHNQLYVQYFGNLKPKHHHLVHYPFVMKMSGPLHHLWSMRSEQKHRESKLTMNVSCSFRNILQTLVFKAQLRLGHILNSDTKSSDQYGTLSNLPLNFAEKYSIFDANNPILSCNWIEHLGTLYKPGVVLIVDWRNEFPSFGIIENIVLYENNSYLVCKVLNTISFWRHIHAYHVSLEGNVCKMAIFQFNDLHSYMPCLLTIIDKKHFVGIPCAV